MPEQNRYSRARRALAALAVIALGACAEPAESAGYVELRAAAVRGATCDPGLQGELRLTGVGEPEATVISGGELCAGAPLRRELTPGLYTLSWRSAPGAGASELPASSALQRPVVLSLFAGQVTRLRVQIEPAVEGVRTTEGAEVEATCAYVAGSSSAS